MHSLHIDENIPLAPMTTLGVGGPARYFCQAQVEDDIREAVVFARERELPLFILGGGSNLVISDRGFAGLVVKISLAGLEQEQIDGNRVLFHAAAGEDWDVFVARTVDVNCAGLECLSGIPGTVGGTPVQNVGGYGQEVSETIIEVRALHLESLDSVTFSNSDCQFAYRRSRFNATDSREYAITRVSFSLERDGMAILRYADLQRYFANRDGQPTLSEVRTAIREIRRGKAMLIEPGDEDARSAGSFFKNPIVSEEQFAALAARVGMKSEQLPNYPADRQRKIPAAWLVEQAGFHRGFTQGAVGISRRHALAIVNRGGATAAEIVALKDEIQSRVHEQFGIELQPEPVFVGF